jgi:ATP-binding cassette subfamily F protein 3
MSDNNQDLILKVSNFEKSYGTKDLLEKAELKIHQGDKVTLLGQNGCGKTTFIKCIAGEDDYYGELDLNPEYKIALMEQEKSFENTPKTFTDYLEEKKNKLLEKQSELEEKFTDPEIFEDTVKYEKLLADCTKIQIRAETNIDEQKIKDILKELGFEMSDYNKPVYSLSGGQKIKLRLAEILSRDADFFILDEPTNHLDFKSIKWLEQKIKNTDKTFLLISHDRHFVSVVSNRIIEIENKEFISYNCGFNNFLIRKKKRHEEIKNKFTSVEREKKRLKKSEEEKRKWAHLVGSKKMKIQADNIKRRSDNLGTVLNPDEFNETYDLKFYNGEFTATQVFKAQNLNKEFTNQIIFKDVDFLIEKQERIVLLGKNGIGKSTLLKMFSGIDQDYNGKLQINSDLHIGYLDQEFKDMDPKQTVMQYLWEADQSLMEHHVISYLVQFGFDLTRIDNKIEKLSGGEKTRISLVKLMLSRYDVLLLDEPTNNLDVELIESLEKALNKYKGTIVFVSHDRRFIDRVAKKIFIIKNQKIEVLSGDYQKFSINS